MLILSAILELVRQKLTQTVTATCAFLNLTATTDSGSDDDAFLGFGDPGDTPVFTWDKSYGPRPNPIPDFDDSNTGPTNSLNAEATALDFFSLFIDDAIC